jgi:hypothetical protein
MECGGLAAAFEADPRLVAYENLATNTLEPPHAVFFFRNHGMNVLVVLW